jgi:purine-nucleoside/S-methyl-5'-thioadenosine phosphorylase / adenosine deaminase
VTARRGDPAEDPWRPFELAPGVLAVFTSRHGGVSGPPFDSLNLGGGVGDDPVAVARNRQLAAQACGRSAGADRVAADSLAADGVAADGVAAGGIAWMRQVHGSDVAYVPAGPDSVTGSPLGAAPAPAVDAIFTDVPGLPLGVLVADCAPVLIADPQARIVGAAHAGREGMADGVVLALVRAMIGAGADPARLRAAIGPAICGGCYEVPAQLRARIADAVPQAGCVTRKGSPGIDIRSGVVAQLAEAGVLAVSRDPRCTAETPALYSYRRDGLTGRFAGLVWLAS